MNDLLSHLGGNVPQALEFLEQIVMSESPSFEKTLVDQCVRLIGERFSAIGGRTDVVRAERFGDHLRVRFDGGSGDGILLLGHADTVWPAGETGRRPFKIEGNRALGPGVFDMKAGIVGMWLALGALRNVRGGLPRPVTVLLTSDEEVGSGSSRPLIEREAGRCRAVLVCEPPLPGGALKTARKGVGRFTVKAIGKAAHAGIDPSKGINAIEEIARQIIKLQTMNEPSRGTTITVGVVQGGTRSNVVPAEAAAEIDVRIASMEEAERVSNRIKSLAPELPGARLEIRGAVNRPPMERTSDTARLFEAARRVAAEIGIELQEGSTGGASDGNFTSAIGVPTLDGLGPEGDGAHALEEWVDIESMPRRAALLAGLIEKI